MGLSWHNTALLHIALGDHEHAWDLARQDYRVFTEIVARHPELADEALAATTGQPYAEDMAVSVVDGLIHADVDRGLALADRVLPPDRAAAMRERAQGIGGADLREHATRLAASMAAGGPGPAELASRLPFVRLHGRIVLAVAERSSAGLWAALDDAVGTEHPVYRARLVSAAMEGIAILDPTETLALVRSPRWSELPAHDDVLAAIVRHVVVNHPEDALVLVSEILDEETREFAHFTLVKVLAEMSSPLLDQALAGITWAGIRAEAHAAIGIAVAGNDPARARRMLDTAVAIRAAMTDWASPL